MHSVCQWGHSAFAAEFGEAGRIDAKHATRFWVARYAPPRSELRAQGVGPDYLVGDATVAVMVPTAEHNYTEPLERDGDQIVGVRRRDTAGEASEEAFCVFG
jgi:hypothetical protein